MLNKTISSQLFEYPLNSSVWGTFADWLIVIVTAITGYFLYKTLQSQIHVQKIQNHLFKMEQVRLSMEIKPRLSFQIKDVIINPTDVHISVTIKNEGNTEGRNLQVYEVGKKSTIHLPESRKAVFL